MNEILHETVADVLDYLVTAQNKGLRPREARVRLQEVRGRHPELEIDLLSEEQAFDESFHYDALIRRRGEGSVSLSYCPERAVPWPLRGVHRWSEGDLVRVNDSVLQVDVAMACLDFIWDEAPIIERLINMCLIQEELERNPITLTDEELQAAMDRFRAAKKLFKAEDTRQWLERNGMSQERLERYVSETAIVPKLRDRVSDGRVEEYFRRHHHDFDTARIARIETPNEGQARELAAMIRSGKQDFLAAAEHMYLDAAQRGAPTKAGVFATMERRETPSSFRDELFTAAPGDLVGPVRTETGHQLIRVLEIVPATLDSRTETAIREILFNEWLRERRQAATIEWCWGNASKTPGAA